MSARATCTSCGWTHSYPTRAAATATGHTCPPPPADSCSGCQALEARLTRLEARIDALTTPHPPTTTEPTFGPTTGLTTQISSGHYPGLWIEDALCTQTDPEAFHPTKGGNSRAAKAVCTRCPVQADCLDHALTHHEEHGIWGGLSTRERRLLSRTNRQR